MRRSVVIFSMVQLLGIASSWFWEHPYSVFSSFLWGVSFFALLPGNLLGPWAVQSLLWQKGLTLGTLSVIAIVLCVGINAVFWFLVVAVCRRLRIAAARRRFRQKPT